MHAAGRYRHGGLHHLGECHLTSSGGQGSQMVKASQTAFPDQLPRRQAGETDQHKAGVDH